MPLLHASVLQYLDTLVASNPDDEELGVALQCLRESFGDAAASADGAATSIPPLLETFAAGVAAAPTQPKSPASTSAVQTIDTAYAPSTPSAAPDAAFDRFVAGLEERGYFAGSTKSEYETRLEEARVQFTARFGTNRSLPSTCAVEAGTEQLVPALQSGVTNTGAASKFMGSTPSDAEFRAAAALLASGDYANTLAQTTQAIDDGASRSTGDASNDRLVALLGLRTLALISTEQYEAALTDAERAAVLATHPAVLSGARAHLAVALEGVGRAAEACDHYAHAFQALCTVNASVASARTEPCALLLSVRERLVRARATSGSEASCGVMGMSTAAAAPTTNAPSSAATAAAAETSCSSRSTLALRPSAASASAGPPTTGGFDMSMMSAFLSDPEVLATASRVADSFLEGTPEGADAAQMMMASFFGLQANTPPALGAVNVQPVAVPTESHSQSHAAGSNAAVPPPSAPESGSSGSASNRSARSGKAKATTSSGV